MESLETMANLLTFSNRIILVIFLKQRYVSAIYMQIQEDSEQKILEIIVARGRRPYFWLESFMNGSTSSDVSGTITDLHSLTSYIHTEWKTSR